VGARAVVEGILQRRAVSPVVLSEIPRAILPPDIGTVTPTGIGGPVTIPKGWETVVVGGRERIRVPEVYRARTPPVLEPFDPNVVIGVPQDETATAEQEETEEMAHTWGHIFRSGVEAVATNWWDGSAATPGIIPSGRAGATFVGSTGTGSPGAAQYGGAMTAASCEPCGPRYLTYDCKTGKFSKKRRRGRRRLATDRDLSDLAAIVAITGKGSAMNQAVAGMVRR